MLEIGPAHHPAVNLHGGGFALMDPLIDDRHNSYFCHTHSIVVISLEYYKAPTHRFPIAVNALTDLVLSILSDDSLPIDRSKVVIGGTSAGATLALAISQDDRLQGSIHGAICLCPVLDFTCDEQRAQDYETLKARKGGNVLPLDGVRGLSACYVNAGQDLTDPRVSPAFADRRDLPAKLCVVGCELDGLCGEAERWARGLVGGKVGEGNGWEVEGVRWEKVIGEEHGKFFVLSPGCEV